MSLAGPRSLPMQNMRGIDGNIITICVLSDGVDALLDERAVPYVQGRDYVVEVRVDGALVLAASDGDIAVEGL